MFTIRPQTSGTMASQVCAKSIAADNHEMTLGQKSPSIGLLNRKTEHTRGAPDRGEFGDARIQ